MENFSKHWFIFFCRMWVVEELSSSKGSAPGVGQASPCWAAGVQHFPLSAEQFWSQISAVWSIPVWGAIKNVDWGSGCPLGFVPKSQKSPKLQQQNPWPGVFLFSDPLGLCYCCPFPPLHFQPFLWCHKHLWGLEGLCGSQHEWHWRGNHRETQFSCLVILMTSKKQSSRRTNTGRNNQGG